MEEKTACFFCRELNKTVFLETIIIVYKARMSDIHTFIGNCEGLDEYYLVTVDLMELYSITDHDDLLYIDVRRNKIKKLTTSE
ncbi:hypothetical protein NXV79_13710 [Bacteroides thetaiotaomicron]|jgi:hypothetical protein|uniref:hypothetical protein n=1 Tax=Bacteroides thetaiotaomicron TaxID=818 RepID=UPI001CE38ABB|nr:hypothetical protein [Bacteroides thetaiotaomicron]MCS2619007.1 hypothetical protein [Bacteroides thetaiotaomicron]MCS2865339.1 hypothetical protein [Bacteroides thetaiotaomicron]MCS3042438.1 hypothetical protein [Bacteroides thetaiotaomicron]MDC2272612.1 hypothetical protein [Bacteroides thetaiotaomicron]UVP59121.1 hypothetical protein NXV79_13710 [Bacteroides thetaiotaomicron]